MDAGMDALHVYSLWLWNDARRNISEQMERESEIEQIIESLLYLYMPFLLRIIFDTSDFYGLRSVI